LIVINNLIMFQQLIVLNIKHKNLIVKKEINISLIILNLLKFENLII
jgi:hypothetical protein